MLEKKNVVTISIKPLVKFLLKPQGGSSGTWLTNFYVKSTEKKDLSCDHGML